MNQLKIINLEFVEPLRNEDISLKGGFDVDLAADLDAELDVLFRLGEPTIVFGRSSGAAAGAVAASEKGNAVARAFAKA